MSRRTRSFAGLAAVLAFAFAQVASAAVACQFLFPVPEPAMETPMAGGHEGCEAATENPNVCNHHCQYGAAATDGAKVQPAPDLAVGPVVAVIEVPLQSLPPGYRSPAFSPANGPPPAARPLPLRI